MRSYFAAATPYPFFSSTAVADRGPSPCQAGRARTTSRRARPRDLSPENQVTRPAAQKFDVPLMPFCSYCHDISGIIGLPFVTEVEVGGRHPPLPWGFRRPILRTNGLRSRPKISGRIAAEPAAGLRTPEFLRDVQLRGLTVTGAIEWTLAVTGRHRQQGESWSIEEGYLALRDLSRVGRLNGRHLISEVVPPSSAPAIYRPLLGAKRDLLGVVFDWRT